MEIDQDTERSVWNFGNYLRTALFLLFACAILSHDRTDLALLEGGVSGPAIYNNWIGFLGAHAARAMFYTFGLATYPFLLILFLLLLRRFIPGLPRRGTLWWALPVILLGSSMLFAMWPQQFIAETDHLGIGRMEQSAQALSGGVVGASLAAPQASSGIPGAGFIRRYIGDVGTVLVALAFLLPGLVFLFIRDWLPLIMIAFRADPEKDKSGKEEEPAPRPVSTGRIYTPENPDGVSVAASAPEIHLYGEEDGEEDTDEQPAEKRSSEFMTKLGTFIGLRRKPDAPPRNDDEEEDGDIIAPPVRAQSPAARRPQAVIRDQDEVVAPPQRQRTARPAPGAVIRDPDELVVTPRPSRTSAVPPVSVAPPSPEPDFEPEEEPVIPVPPEPEDDFEEDLPEPEPAPAPKPAPRVIPTHSYAENKAGYDRERPPKTAASDLPAAPPPVYEEYHLPSPMLLERHGDEINQEDKAYIQSATDKLEETLSSFHVGGIISDITVGPRVTQFEIALDAGVKVEKITSIQGNIAMALEAQSIRIRAPIPGKNAVGIEVPNKASSTVYLRPLLESATWRESHAAIPILLGRDISGKVYMTDLAKAPHMLIAGSTGSGKSVCMNTLIMSLLFRFSPDDLKLIMVDPKVVELEMYRPIPHLITPVVNDPKKVPLALRWGVNEMERRYMVLAKVKAKNLAAFNSRPPDPQPVLDDYGNVVPPKLPILIIIIDELADIMMTDAKSDVEQSICRIAQKGRAAGLHLVIATQSPRKEVVTGLIKANIPTKIAFRVSNGMDSRVILDAVGAEKLLGNGDMLFNPPGGANLERVQGAYVSDPEIAKVIDEVAAQRPQTFDEGIFAGADEEDEDDEPKGRRGKGKPARGGYDDEMDDYDEVDGMVNSDVIRAAADRYLLPDDPPIMVKALEIIINDQQVSTSYLQRRLGIGYNKAADIIDKLEQRHIISAPLPGGQKRSILITDGLETSTD
jgi:S-DNA-T family DNA segregation ATPase FtsK/SpoIIIE